MRTIIDLPVPGTRPPVTDATALDDALFGIATDGAAVALVEDIARRIAPADIAAAFHTSQARHGPGGLVMIETTVLLLEGGLAFLDLISSPLDMRFPQTSDVAAGWARWRASGSGGYEIERRGNGTWSTICGAEIERDVQGTEHLAGTRVSSTAWSSGPTTITRYEALVMTSSGEIERRGARLATFSENRILSSTVRSSYSEWSSVDVAGRDENDAIVHDRYTMLDDGLTLEIRHADGRVERHLGFSLGGDFVMDGRRYRATGRQASLSDANTATRDAGGGGSWLALMAEADEERERYEGKGSATLAPDVLAREAARRAR